MHVPDHGIVGGVAGGEVVRLPSRRGSAEADAHLGSVESSARFDTDIDAGAEMVEGPADDLI